MAPDPWDVTSTTPRTPGNQPLPRLDELAKWAAEKLRPIVAPIAGKVLFSWDSGKLDEVKDKFIPKTAAGEMGCMKACYNVLGILYGPAKSRELQVEVYRRAYKAAEAWAGRNKEKFDARVEEVKAAAQARNETPSDKEIRRRAIDSFTSPWNSADHLFDLMREKDLAGNKVDVRNTEAEKAIRDMTGDAAGVYFYGMAVRDNHTVTLAVERAADGTQKMYWLDQNHPKASREIAPGKLGETLQAVPGHTSNSHIWALKPGG
jgi:hypothetical protein